MKLRILSIFLIAITLTVLIAPQLACAVDAAACRIVRLGNRPGSGSGVMVQLVDTRAGLPSWPDGEEGKMRQFYLHPDLGNAGYATLLTAYTLGKTVWVRIADPASTGSLITIVYIND